MMRPKRGLGTFFTIGHSRANPQFNGDSLPEMKESDQQQHHAACGERCPQPGDEGRVITAGMGNNRRYEPQRQCHQRERRNAVCRQR